ncbi:TetR/AcrR family transcriptional regulator [Bacillus sp. 31A1R]|uniref:TetR/AcrR family transcriptional regulator n=1 Tax=Robertmurraya mangrovi TaxID=3098077 RepID=A0ABU5J114_9BACI|nr:TetR/AcrR family transcriptional regulator [Bacillus sp. 31A1R]MDZ5473097.1 TetR/AcrR family transcriptional regulator [Bacillus sp. 31A1R]
MKAKQKRSLGRPPTNARKMPTDVMILQAATDMFLTNGFQDVSIDDVAKKCNVTKATVYYYFESKAALFTEAMVHMMNRIGVYIEAMLSEEEPLKIRLHKVAVAHLKATFDLDLDGFLRETKNVLTHEQLKQMKESENKMFEVLEKAFIKAIEEEEIPEVNTKFATHSYLALLKVGNYRNEDQTTIFSSINETSNQIIDLFWNGLFSTKS